MNVMVRSYYIFKICGLFVGMLLIISGCAITPRIDWQARVGHYTFDQALEELGPPDKMATLRDGTVIADWLTQGSRTIITQTQGGGYYPYGPGPIMAPTTTIINTPKYYVRLTFDPASELRAWKKFAQ